MRNAAVNKFWLSIACMVVFSCANYKDIKPASPDYYSLKPGDILWVHIGTASRYRVTFKKLEGDSLLASPRSFMLDSIRKIEKESYSGTETGLLAGGVWVAGVGLSIYFVTVVLGAYVKIFSLF